MLHTRLYTSKAMAIIAQWRWFYENVVTAGTYEDYTMPFVFRDMTGEVIVNVKDQVIESDFIFGNLESYLQRIMKTFECDPKKKAEKVETNKLNALYVTSSGFFLSKNISSQLKRHSFSYADLQHLADNLEKYIKTNECSSSYFRRNYIGKPFNPFESAALEMAVNEAKALLKKPLKQKWSVIYSDDTSPSLEHAIRVVDVNEALSRCSFAGSISKII